MKFISVKKLVRLMRRFWGGVVPDSVPKRYEAFQCDGRHATLDRHSSSKIVPHLVINSSERVLRNFVKLSPGKRGAFYFAKKAFRRQAQDIDAARFRLLRANHSSAINNTRSRDLRNSVLSNEARLFDWRCAGKAPSIHSFHAPWPFRVLDNSLFQTIKDSFCKIESRIFSALINKTIKVSGLWQVVRRFF